MTEDNREKEKPPVHYVRFKELVDQIREFKTENAKLRAQLEILEKVLNERLRS